MENFITAVHHMRESQKQYFRNRKKEDLQNSIEWEKKVDDQLKAIKIKVIKSTDTTNNIQELFIDV